MTSSFCSDHEVYSGAVHKLIIVINAGAIAFLQVVINQSNSIFKTHQPTLILSSFLFIFIYAFLRVCEAVKIRTNYSIAKCLGHVSHLFGALSALLLLSLVSPIFFFIVAPFWLLWFCFVVYITFIEIIFSEKNDPGVHQPVY